MSPPFQNERAALDAVLARAETDVAFRARLLDEPRAALLETVGVRLPADFRIRFMERDSDVDALIVLPDLRRPTPAAADELADDDLERVTGGAHAHNAHLAWKGAVAPQPAAHARPNDAHLDL